MCSAEGCKHEGEMAPVSGVQSSVQDATHGAPQALLLGSLCQDGGGPPVARQAVREGGEAMRRRLPPLVGERDRFAAAALQVDRLLRYMRRRTMEWHQLPAGAPLPTLEWAHYTDSAGALYSVKQ